MKNNIFNILTNLALITKMIQPNINPIYYILNQPYKSKCGNKDKHVDFPYNGEKHWNKRYAYYTINHLHKLNLESHPEKNILLQEVLIIKNAIRDNTSITDRDNYSYVYHSSCHYDSPLEIISLSEPQTFESFKETHVYKHKIDMFYEFDYKLNPDACKRGIDVGLRISDILNCTDELILYAVAKNKYYFELIPDEFYSDVVKALLYYCIKTYKSTMLHYTTTLSVKLKVLDLGIYPLLF